MELDIHLCEDELVVIHDDTLERTSNGKGLVSSTPLAELRRLDAGNGATIPLLDEVFDILPPEIGINIELKGKATAERLARWLPGTADRAILLSSFDHQSLEDFRRKRGDYRLAPLFGRWNRSAINIALDFGSGYINLGRKLVSRQRIDEINRVGLRALVYTVNEPEEARRFFDYGVWGVFTDFPDRISREWLLTGG